MTRYAAVKLLLFFLALFGGFGATVQLATNPSRLRATLGSDSGATFIFAPDGKMVATQDLEQGDRKVRLWDTSSGKEQLLRCPNLDRVGGVAWAPNSRFLVLAEDEGGLRLWDAQKREERVVVLSTGGGFLGSQFSPASNFWAVSDFSSEKRFRVFDTEDGKELLNVAGDLQRIAFAPDRETLALARSDSIAQRSAITLWDVRSKRPKVERLVHGDAIACMAYSPDGKILVTAESVGARADVTLWDALTLQKQLSFTAADSHGPAKALAFSPDGSFLVVRCSTVTLWDLSLKHPHKMADLAADPQFTPDGALMSVVTEGGFVESWRLAPVGKLASFQLPCPPFGAFSGAVVPSALESACLLPDGTTLALGTALPPEEPGIVTSLKYKLGLLSSIEPDQCLKLYDASRAKHLVTFPHCVSGAISPDGNTLATRSTNGNLYLWNLPPARPLEYWLALWTSTALFTWLLAASVHNIVKKPKNL